MVFFFFFLCFFPRSETEIPKKKMINLSIFQSLRDFNFKLENQEILLILTQSL
jgi:hypothetical protein